MSSHNPKPIPKLDNTAQQALLQLWQAAIAFAHPQQVLDRFDWKHGWGQLFGQQSPDNLHIFTIGKASVGMAQACIGQPLLRNRIRSALVVTPESTDTQQLKALPEWVNCHLANHPTPSAASVAAGKAVLAHAKELDKTDHALVLLSGGASSLLCLPTNDITWQDKLALTRQLLHCGATIDEINCVRRQFSQLKGGGLAQAMTPAASLTIAISDVPGDDPLTIGSGPTVSVKHPTADRQRARVIIERYALAPSPAMLTHLQTSLNHNIDSHGSHQYCLGATPAQALQTAAKHAEQWGWGVVNLGDECEGEAAHVAANHAQLAREIQQGQHGVTLPCLLLSGGETQVTLPTSSMPATAMATTTTTTPPKGGRNTEYALSLAYHLKETNGITALIADTDGIDGVGGHAGAWVDSHTYQRAQAMQLNMTEHLQHHRSYDFFAALEQLFTTGATGTNVNDFRAILINPAST